MNPTDYFITIPVLILIFSWLIGDILIAAYFRPKFGTQTITSRIIQLSQKYPAIPFMVGLVIDLVGGHLFGQF